MMDKDYDDGYDEKYNVPGGVDDDDDDFGLDDDDATFGSSDNDTTDSSKKDDDDFGLGDDDDLSDYKKPIDLVDNTYKADDTVLPPDLSDDDAAEDTDDEEQEEERGGYVHEPSGPNYTGLIIGIIIALLLVGGAATYLFYYRPMQAEKERIALEEQKKQELAKAEADRKAKAAAAKKEAERLAAQKAAEDAAKKEPQTGVLEIINDKTGRSYVVISSFLDDDMAKDEGNRLVEQGNNVYIISPRQKGFYRVAIDVLDTYDDAVATAESLKGTYGENVWALKY